MESHSEVLGCGLQGVGPAGHRGRSSAHNVRDLASLPPTRAVLLAVFHALSGGVSLPRTGLQLPRVVGQLQQRDFLPQPVQHVGNLRLRESGERAGGGAEPQRAGGAGAQGQQDAAALQRVRADPAAPRPAASQPVRPRRRRAARLAPQAPGAPRPPGERDPEDRAPAAPAPAPESLSVIGTLILIRDEFSAVYKRVRSMMRRH